MTQRKIVGGLATFIGVAIWLFPIFIRNDNIINRNVDIFLVKYFLVIFVANAGLYFVVMGVMQYIGAIPTFSESDSSDDPINDKITVLRYVLIAPFIVSGTATIIVTSDKLAFVSIWILFVLYLTYSFMTSLINLLAKKK